MVGGAGIEERKRKDAGGRMLGRVKKVCTLTIQQRGYGQCLLSLYGTPVYLLQRVKGVFVSVRR